MFCFSRGRDPRALPAAMVSYVRENYFVSLKNRTGILLDHITDKLYSAAGARDVSEMFCGSDPEPAVPTVQLVQWDMDLFTVLLPLRLLSSWSSTPWPLPLSPASSHNHDITDRIYWITPPVLSYGCVSAFCVCLGCQCVVKDKKTQTKPKTVSMGHDQHVLLFLPGAMLNFIFKF